jgi:hypothetical protein
MKKGAPDPTGCSVQTSAADGLQLRGDRYKGDDGRLSTRTGSGGADGARHPGLQLGPAEGADPKRMRQSRLCRGRQ